MITLLRRSWVYYVVPFIAVGCALPIRLFLDEELGMRAPALPFFFAVALCAWVGGLVPGLLATLLSIAAAGFFVPNPLWTQSMSGTWVLLAMMVGAGVLVSALGELAFRNRAIAARRQTYLDEALDPVFAWRRDGTIEFWGGGARRLYGFTSREAVGRRVEDLLHVVWPVAFDEILSALDREGGWNGELRHTDRDGRSRIVQARMQRVRENGHDVIVESTRDITDRRNAEARLDMVLASVGDFLVSFDRWWRFTYVNDAAAAFLGKHTDELIGQCVWKVFPQTVGTTFYRDVHEAAAEQREIRADHFYQPRDTWFENHIYPSAEGVTVFSTDITERKRMEERLRSDDQRKNEFIATLGHELRGPLAPLRNGIHIVQAKANGEPALAKTAAVMERQVQQLVRLIDDLLDVGRISRGRLELRRSAVSMNAKLLTCLDDARTAIEERGLHLDTALSNEPLLIHADPARLAQIIENLLTNAMKYTDRGGTLHVTTRREAQLAVIEVRDNGIGIPAVSLPSVFDMFEQVPEHKERANGGLGIGLALVRNLVEMHGGTVTAHSEGEGCGSTFTVRLPLLPSQVEHMPASNDAATPDVSSSERVLVVDDNRDSAESLALLLKTSGYEVETAFDATMASQAGRSFQPDVVLLDLGMPDLDGYATARLMRMEPWCENVRIIALTGWGQEADRRRSMEAGFDAHLVKPVDMRLLYDALAAHATH